VPSAGPPMPPTWGAFVAADPQLSLNLSLTDRAMRLILNVHDDRLLSRWLPASGSSGHDAALAKTGSGYRRRQ